MAESGVGAGDSRVNGNGSLAAAGTLAIISETPISFDGVRYLHSQNEGIYIDSLARHFREVILFTYAFRPGDADYVNTATYCFEAGNLRVIEMPLARPGRFFKLRKLWQLARAVATICRRAWAWDVAYVFIPGYNGAFAAIVYRLLHRPYFAYLASDWPEEAALLIPLSGAARRYWTPAFRWFVSWLQETTIGGAQFTLTAGTELHERYASKGTRVEETIPRLTWSEYSLYDRADTCTGAVITLLLVANLIERKGAAYLVRAVELLRARSGRDIRCVIVGWGPQEESLRRQVHEAGLEGIVLFTGHLQAGSELRTHFRNADFFIFPSFSGEGFPRVLYEALSQSLPVVASDICGISRKLHDRVHLRLVPPQSAEAIADTVIELLEDADLRRSLIRNGREWMRRLMEGPRGDQQVMCLLRRHVPRLFPG